uniref:Uncharacterized protein n=1 Tax=Arundo donax TaxID=35708 RepID=A0A0A9AJI0_ARUDO
MFLCFLMCDSPLLVNCCISCSLKFFTCLNFVLVHSSNVYSCTVVKDVVSKSPLSDLFFFA